VNRANKIAKRVLSRACPISKEYGGIRSGGGFDDYTEYEVAARGISEAAHCILGSLGRIYGATIRNIRHGEDGHLKEEIGIIKNIMVEYSNPRYIKDWFVEDADKSIESMQRVSANLKRKANALKGDLISNKGKYSDYLFEAAKATYELLEILGNEILGSVRGVEILPSKNAFDSGSLKNAVKKLSVSIK